MRLTCPNCDAQYEVDDNVIPKDGRDVQCSSCGQTWFQNSASQLEEDDTSRTSVPEPTSHEPDVEPEAAPEPEATPEPEDTAPEPEDTAPEPEDTAPEPEDAAPEPEDAAPEPEDAAPEPEDAAHEPEDAAPEPEDAAPEPEDAAPEPEDVPDLEPQKHDEAVLDILREEAALESEARNAETSDETQGGLETQTDLSLDQSEGEEALQVAAVSQRTARLRGIEPEDDKQETRSDLLPDIEEINSSLQAESAVETEDALTEKKRGRSGFRLGFGLIVILATLLFLAYAYAPLIVEKMPASEPYMISYVEKVDSLRLWLDQLMRSATDKMSGGTAES